MLSKWLATLSVTLHKSCPARVRGTQEEYGANGFLGNSCMSAYDEYRLSVVVISLLAGERIGTFSRGDTPSPVGV